MNTWDPFSAWETLLEVEQPLHIALRYAGTPDATHDDAINRWEDKTTVVINIKRQ